MPEDKIKILLVEDDSVTARVQIKDLKTKGYMVHHADTGEKAVAAVVESTLSVDLILMDIDLGAGIDGTEAAEKILACKDMPVVFLSTHTDPAVVEKTERITSYGYVVKNSGIVVLDASIKMALKLFNSNQERRRIEDVLQESNRRLESFLRISSSITSPLSRDQLMQSIVDNAAGVLGISSGAVYLLKDDDKIYLEAAVPSLPENFPEAFRIASLKEHPHINDAIKSGKYVVLPDILTAKLTPAEQEITRLRNLRSQLFLPIMLKGSSIGVLILASIDNLYTFTEEVITLLQGFGNQAAQILENVRSYDKVKNYAKEMEQVIQERKAAEEKLRQSEEYNRSMIEAIPDIIILTNSGGEYLDIRASSEEHLAMKKDDLLGKKVADLFPEETAREIINGINDALNSGKLKILEYGLTLPAGEFFYEARIVPRDANRALALIRDITDRNRAEKEIKKQLSEKEILLKEIHHRVKNNIANIEGLLLLQLEESRNPEVKSALQDALSRVQSIRILYDKLLLGVEYQDISIKDYIGSLIDSLAGIFYEGANISVEKHIADFTVSSIIAIPVGIIVNELLTNVYKYAFNGISSGKVSVVIKKNGNLASLTIHDNGMGINAEIESGKTSGFGLTIVRMLADQLKGSYTILNDNGTKNVVKFQC